jgi:hypothetical protein
MKHCPPVNTANQVALVIATVLSFLTGNVSAQSPDRVRYGHDVHPILSDKCYKCHGPDENARQADLRLDRRDDAEHVLVGDGPLGSELLNRIHSDDEAERMPPHDSNLSLSQDEITTLTKWIEQGAPYDTHWAFVPPAKSPLPSIEDAAWPRNGIDYFVLAGLEATGQSPTSPADRARIVRRLTFDLTGLPPTIEEVDAFLGDTSHDAYERLVDRLLASNAYGERMASNWLDLARYSDTYGYQVDRDRHVWPWRDWVVQALNDNMLYDDFITCQLAGDLLPNPSDNQILATTFNRLHPQKVEGGSVPEEFRVEYVADRNHTFATAFLGLTLECARCHDHKFDPISQREYYQLFAFFNNIDEAGLYSYFTESVPTPTLMLADDDQKAAVLDAEKNIENATHELAVFAETRRIHFDDWLSKSNREPRGLLVSGLIAHHTFEDFVGKSDGTSNQSTAGRIGKAVLLTGDDGIALEVGNFARNDPFSIALWMNTPEVKERAVVFHRSRAWTDAASRGYQLLIEDGRLSASLIHFWPGNSIRVKTKEVLPVGHWQHVAITYDGSSRAAGLGIFVNGKRAACEVVRDKLTRKITGGGSDNITIGERFRDRGFTDGKVDEFQVFDRQLTVIEIEALFGGVRGTGLSSEPATDLRPQDKTDLWGYYLSAVDVEYQARRSALRELRQHRNELVDASDEIMVMREMSSTRRVTHLLDRGAYDAPTEVLSADTPKILRRLSESEPHDRLGLAHWLTDPGHPLTARVAVNRFWKLCFGYGLVRTPEDFGSQGQPPTHPELLDWLAREFVAQGWDTKRLLKTIVMSATYRQDSRTTLERLTRDPLNERLGRGPRHRLPAEMIRDNALAASGILVRKSGGPPAKPYEVGVSFKPVSVDEGEGLYRRSLYTYWKQTAPAPVMMTLDAAKREVCSARRERTTSPLQALVMLNDPQLVEAARMIGSAAIQRHPQDPNAMVVRMFRCLTSRRPETAEMSILRRLYDEQLSFFEQHPEDAEKLLDGRTASIGNVPQQAAAQMVASTLLNLDACVIKR